MNMSTKTSETDPIRVDFVELEKFGLKGKLGLTFAPGKVNAYSWTANWQRDLDTDLLRLRDFYGCHVLVSLIEKHEFEMLKIPNLRDRAREFGMDSIWFSIRDMSIPRDTENFALTVREISDLMANGKTIVVHCMGGLGRAGLVSACCLVTKDIEPGKAIKEVRLARPGAIQTREQEEFIYMFAESYYQQTQN